MEAVKTEERQSYSVWAIPPDEVSCRIKKLMGGLRAEFGGPQIEPHIPPCGFNVQPLKPFVLQVEMETGVDFNLWNPPLPQMSLLYGHLTEEERKKAQEKVYILDQSITALSFPVTHIALYQTNYKDKTLRSWEKIAEYRLHFNN